MPPRSSARSSRAAAASRSPWEVALSQLRALCGKASKAQCDEITAAEVSAALDGLRHKPGHLGLWTAVGEDSLAGLVALFGLALRRCCPALAPQLSADSHATFGALRVELCLGLPQTFEDHANGDLPASTPGAVAQGLIRTQVLRCYSVLLSQAAEQLQRRRSHRGVQAASKLLDEVGVLLSLFTAQKGMLPWAPAGFDAELYAELCASGLLEHFARLMLLLVGCEEAGATLRTQAADCLYVVSTALASLMPSADQDLVRFFADSPSFAYLLSAHVAGMCAALDGGTLFGAPTESVVPAREVSTAQPGDATGAPCVRAAAALWAIFMWAQAMRQGQQQLQNDLHAAGCPQRYPAAAADGAPPRVPAAAAPDSAAISDAAWCQDLWRIQVRRVRGMGDAPIGGDDGAQAGPASAPAPLRRWVGCASAPPLHTRAVFELSLRLAAAAVRQMREEQQQHEVQPPRRSGQVGRAAASGNRRRPLPPRFVSKQARDLAVRGLQCAYIAADEVAMQPRVPQSVHLKLEAFWRVLLEAVELMGRAGAATPDGAAWEYLMQLMRPERIPQGAVEGLPSAPTPDVAACLNAGWVGCVERLLRQADAPQQLPLSMEPNGLLQEAAVCQVLAFGRLREVLSLLATAAKRVRWFARRPPRAANLRSPFEHCVADMQLLVSQLPFKLLGALEHAARQPEACACAPVVGTAASPDADATIDGRQGAAAHSGGPEDVAGAAAATVPEGASGAAAVTGSGGCSAAGAAESDGLRQLRIAVSFAIVHLLPAMCRAFERFPMVLDWFRRDESPACGRAAFSTMSLFAAWLPLMAAAYTYTDWGAQLFDARVVAPVLWAVLRYAAFVSASTALDADFTPMLVYTLQALCRLAPALLAGAVQRVEATEDGLSDGGGNDVPAASSGAVAPPRVSLLRRVLGPGGAAQDAELLAAVEAVCAEHGGAAGSGAGDGAGGGGSSNGAEGSAAKLPTAGWREQPPLAHQLGPVVRMAQLLVPPAELAAVLPLCANPACTNLAGDSEADLPLTVLCGGGGGTCQLAYCSAGCRDEHAGKGGHRERCLL